MRGRPEVKATAKSDETKDRIVREALALFQERGFEAATMREIAAKAGVATGAAYYYFPSKDAIVMEFYRRSAEEMQPSIAAALEGVNRFEDRLRQLIGAKLEYFAPNRGVLRALLRNGADPTNPLSPFSRATAGIREIDLAWFQRILENCGMRIPRDLQPHLPGLLWFFQMGVILFWVIEESPGQERTKRLLGLGAKSVASLIRLSALPLMRPLRRTALELAALVKEAEY